MGESAPRWRAARRTVASLAVAALVAVGLTVTGPLVPALADSAPADPRTPTTVAADGLPTVQIDGVAWSQVIVAGTVYVAGQFTRRALRARRRGPRP